MVNVGFCTILVLRGMIALVTTHVGFAAYLLVAMAALAYWKRSRVLHAMLKGANKGESDDLPGEVRLGNDLAQGRVTG